MNGSLHFEAAVFDLEGPEPLDETVELIRRLREAEVRIAAVSTGPECRMILERNGASHLFEVRVDGEIPSGTGPEGESARDPFLEAADRVGADPGTSVVFDDSVSGMKAGRRGEFGLVVGVAADETARVRLREAGADLVWDVAGMDRLDLDLLDAWFTNREHRRPSALARWEELARRLREHRPVIFLDYDGTLTPIVSRPDQAVLPDEMRRVVRRVARRFSTTVVSGRGRSDVEERVGLDQLNYAGSHGFDISGPDRRTDRDGSAGVEGETRGGLRHQAAAELEPVVERVSERLRKALGHVEGAVVEPKRFTVAVHYRMVSDDDFPAVESAVESAVSGHPELRVAHGKKVFEIRPGLDWDKGKAVLWLLEALGLEGPDALPLYVGDDTTDEDAFRALGDRGIGVIVTEAPRPTAAAYQLQDPGEVREFLSRLAGI